MFVDVHTHTPRWKTPPPDGEESKYGALWRPDKPASLIHSWDDFMSAMEIVDRAICFNLASDPRIGEPDSADLEYPAVHANNDTAEFVRAHPEKLIGFLSVHPFHPSAMEEIERGTQDLGLRGIKLGPNYQNVDPVGPESFRVYKRAEELGLPILFHQGTSPIQFADLDYAHPRHIDRVAMAFPNLRMILAHMGHPWQIDCFVVIRKHPHVYADISANFYRPWSYYNALRYATEWGVLHKLLFGSDYPVATPQETLDGHLNVNNIIEGTHLPRVPIDQLEAIAQRDSLALLGLD